MGTLYLVRHGQASFGADDYDCLSELGRRQCLQLGIWLRERGIRFDAALHGSLRRQRASYEAIAEGHGEMPAAALRPQLDEYDSHALLAAAHPGPLPTADTPEAYRRYFQLLREALQRWMLGEIAPAGMPAYADWRAGIVGVLDEIQRSHTGNVLLVASGGPISTAVGHLLQTPPEVTVDLNMRIRNSSLTELAITPRRLMLVAFNHLPHLDHPEREGWITFT
ncbi:histidine phosphatase family protein [Rubrivivax gelatinosus]|uniref:histidine phosphatase family protein n=1 Tax=Rubrivivax gelatinosus TaxID=28068 RepID=UPI001908E009|nr:histidine phosphatase family protein [Rubrivivax gelatinosus]MBK1612826.1 histidine phosphatase family protein [Rubrivivax gelatinosus]